MFDLSWRRDTTPMRVCDCHHGWGMHRIDTKKQPCDVGMCDCPEFTLYGLLWAEHRSVMEVVGGDE